ncbi:AAA domain-containing protein [Fomes fomentarius]|nr:AAA domain-containing protein [Fomes fomentarius]
MIPPLLGAKGGRYRIHIVGNSGTGKSTLARELAEILNVPCITLDTLRWCPGWQKRPREEFRMLVRAALDQDPRGWVVDGNCMSTVGGMVSEEATDVIWLDPPLALYFPRLCWRTVLRMLKLAPPCSPGCEEAVQQVFLSRESMVWCCLSRHGPVRRREAEKYCSEGVHVGEKRRRVGGWGTQLVDRKRAVRTMVDADRPHIAVDG